ncbi:Crp/Fnr family transcriptional regulator [Algoriphagus boritolerans]|uniref:Crp/Fnr family transcriptional regulator n=1 Tax=Algoriphagus boritolerans TaxID=308111 RepID=UPI000AC50149
MDQIKTSFKQRFDISESDWEIFSSKLVKFQYLKNHNLLKAGQIENYLSFVEKGIIRLFIPKEENDITFDFAFENDFVSGYSSFLTQTPSIYEMETLTDTIIWRLKFEDLQTIYKETKIGNFIGRKAGEDLFLKKIQKRTVSSE